MTYPVPRAGERGFEAVVGKATRKRKKQGLGVSSRIDAAGKLGLEAEEAAMRSAQAVASA